MFNEIIDHSRKTTVTLWAVDDDGTKRKIVITAQFPKDTDDLEVGVQVPFDNGTLATIERVEEMIKNAGGTIVNPGGGTGGTTGDTFTKQEIVALLKNKANVADVYTKAAVDDELAKKATKEELKNLVTLEKLTELLKAKADAATSYDIDQVDNLLAKKQDLVIPELEMNKSYKAKQLVFQNNGGNLRLCRVSADFNNYDGTNAKLVTLVDNVSLGEYPLVRAFVDGNPLVKASTYILHKSGLFQAVNDVQGLKEADLKEPTKFTTVFEFTADVDLSDYFTKDEVTAELAKKANLDETYSKTDADAELAKKANADDVYDKAAIDEKFANVSVDGAAKLAEANTFTAVNTFQEAVALTSATITADPTKETDVVNKKYVDAKTNAETGNFNKVSITEGTVDTVGTTDNSITNKKYVDDKITEVDGKVTKLTETVTNNKTETDTKFDIINAKISPDASADNQLADKKFVTDTAAAAADTKVAEVKTELTTKIGEVETKVTTIEGNVTTNTTDLTEIKSKIPAAATADNQLADKAYVEETIANGTGAYITKDENGTEFASNAELLAGPYFSKGKTRKLIALDWTTVLQDETHDNATANYTYDGANWVFKFKIKNQPFTTDQLAAINSGATKAIIDTVADKASLTQDNTLAGINTFTGTVIVPDPTDNGHAVNKAYVDAKTNVETGNFTNIAVTEGTITKEPTNVIDIVNKKYVDAKDALKANVTDVFTKDEINTKLDEKANTADVYTKTETYTKEEVDQALAGIDVTEQLKGVAKLTEANTFTNVNTFSGHATTFDRVTINAVDTTTPNPDGGADVVTPYEFGENDAVTKKYVDAKVGDITGVAKLGEDNTFTANNTFATATFTNGNLTNVVEEDTSLINKLYLTETVSNAQTELEGKIATKANATDTYTKTETIELVNKTVNDKIDNFDHSPYAKVGGANTFTADNTFTGTVIVPTPTATNHAVTKEYVDAKTDVETGNFTKIAITSGTITNAPAGDTDIVNKKYLDDVANLKADKADTYTKTEVDTKFDDYYTKTQTNEKVAEVNQSITDAVTKIDANTAAITKLEQKSVDDDAKITASIDELKKVIPAEATEANQLADKTYVAEAIKNTSAFLVTSNEQGQAFATKAALTAGPYFSKGVEYTPSNHDYAVVLADEENDGATVRYMFDGTNWSFQYKIESTPLTQTQLDAVNSEATAEKIAKIVTNETAIAELTTKVTTLEAGQADSAANKVDKAGDTMTGGLNVELAETGTAFKAQADGQGFKLDVVKTTGNLNLVPIADAGEGFSVEQKAILPRGTTSTLGNANHKFQAVYVDNINDTPVTSFPTIDDATSIDDTKVWSAKKTAEAVASIDVTSENYVKQYVADSAIKEHAYVTHKGSIYKALATSNGVTEEDLEDATKFTKVFELPAADLSKFEPYSLPFLNNDLNVITTKTKDNFKDVLTVDSFNTVYDIVLNNTKADLRDGNGKNKIVFAEASEASGVKTLKLNLAGPFWQFGANGFVNGLILLILKVDTATSAYTEVTFESSCTTILSQTEYDAITTKSDYVLYHITQD